MIRRAPTEPQPRLHPMPVDVLHSEHQVFIFMDVADLESERAAIDEAIETRVGVAPRSGHLGEYCEIAVRFAGRFPDTDPPTPAALATGLELLPRSGIAVLRWRLDQVRQALAFATQCEHPGYGRTRTFAVPPIWCRRWEMMICGPLLPAWVCHLDPSEF